MFDQWSATWAVVVAVVTIALVKGVRWLVAYRAYFIFFNSMPGETDFSLIWGNLHKINNENTEGRLRYFRELNRKYPKYCRFWIGPLCAHVRLYHPDTIKALLKIAGPKSWTYSLAIPWLGEGLLISRGARWHRSRRLLTPAFHFSILKPYNTISNRACDLLLEKVEKYAAEKKSIEMFSNISLCTFDVILQCAMSYTDDIQAQGNPMQKSDWVYNLTANGRKNRKLCDFVHGIAEHVIKIRQQILEEEGGSPKKQFPDFLDILLTARDETGKGLTPLEIRSEVDTFMFEGHDTTASAVSWTLYSLCKHQDVQRKVQQEVDGILKGRPCDDIEWDDLAELDYLTTVIKESLRMHSTVPFVSRVLTEPLTVVEGVTLPEGTMCTVSIQGLHYNPTVWPDPEVFNPDRFLPDNCKDRDSFAFIPFSAGPRNCIGQHFAMNEQKVMVARLLRRYTFSLDPSHEVKKNIAAITRTEDGMKMFAVPRTPSF